MKHSAKNQIILKRATHRNFMSYGNDVNEFTFPEGLNWLSASNGCGKSTEVEVLNFAFFGKSYRGGKRDDDGAGPVDRAVRLFQACGGSGRHDE